MMKEKRKEPAKEHSNTPKSILESQVSDMPPEQMPEAVHVFSKEELLAEIVKRKNEGPFVLAIEGPCGAGKSTLAAWLKEGLNADVVAMDDFYYPREMPRSPVDGNSDLQRIKEEVLEPYRKYGKASYRPFHPAIQELGKPETVDRPVLILEGNYSMHPLLEDFVDLSLFVDIDETRQKERLKERDPVLYDRFIQQWIPDTLRYFSCYGIIGKADLLLSS